MQRFATLLCLVCVSLSAGGLAAAEEGFKPIFDGKTLAGWDGDPRLWRVEDGAITGQTTAENPARRNTFLIWRGGKPGDFELKAEFRMPDEGFANSGIQVRSWEGPAKWQVSGYQADMNDDDKYTGICYGENFRSILAMRGQKVTIGTDHKPKLVEQFGDHAELAKVVKRHDWNEYDIVARGNRIIQKINGHLMCDITDEDTAARKDGIIALQLHAGPPMKVQFRNLRLKDLSQPNRPAGGGAGHKKIVFIAGRPSHGYAEHEHCAGCLLLADCLKQAMPNVETAVYRDGWPTDRKALDDADSIVVFSDGSKSHPILKYLKRVEPLMKRGVGLAGIHYAVTVPKEKAGNQFKDWIGGYYESFWSVNPFWKAEFKEFPDHPVARGLRPFTIEDEWYYHMRFTDDMQGVTPILTAVPPDRTREGPDGENSGNAEVRARKGMPECVAWARQRPDGGRGFGFTGGHWHWNWANDNFRKAVLNGIVWTAKIEVPPEGVCSKTPSLKEMRFFQDKPEPPGFDREKIKRLIEGWK